MTRYTRTNKYAALESYAHDLLADDEIDNETAIYTNLGTMGNPGNPGKLYVRTIQASFLVISKAGNSHRCLVHEVLSNDILNLRCVHSDRELPEIMQRQFLIHLLLALDFLRSECHIIHTGKATLLTRLWETLTETTRYQRREYFAAIDRFIYLRTAGHKGNRGSKLLNNYQCVHHL